MLPARTHIGVFNALVLNLVCDDDAVRWWWFLPPEFHCAKRLIQHFHYKLWAVHIVCTNWNKTTIHSLNSVQEIHAQVSDSNCTDVPELGSKSANKLDLPTFSRHISCPDRLHVGFLSPSNRLRSQHLKLNFDYFLPYLFLVHYLQSSNHSIPKVPVPDTTITNSTELSTTRGKASCAANQEIPRISQNLKVR